MDAGTHDIGGNTPAGIDLAVGPELYHGLTHGFPAFGDGLNLEVVQFIMLTGDLLHSQEGCINGAVTDGDTFQHLLVLVQLQILNYADNTDAKMETVREVLKAAGDNNEWLGFNRLFDSNFRKSTEF